MKQTLLYLSILSVVVAFGCKKLNYQPPPPYPTGTFSGKFGYLHRHTDNVPYDTLLATITLKLKNTDGTFTVTGDTATVHAGSFGTYGINSSYINFADKTFPATGTPAKSHLNGLYLYSYDGASLKMLFYNSDTLRYEYDLTKSAN